MSKLSCVIYLFLVGMVTCHNIYHKEMKRNSQFSGNHINSFLHYIYVLSTTLMRINAIKFQDVLMDESRVRGIPSRSGAIGENGESNLTLELSLCIYF